MRRRLPQGLRSGREVISALRRLDLPTMTAIRQAHPEPDDPTLQSLALARVDRLGYGPRAPGEREAGSAGEQPDQGIARPARDPRRSPARVVCPRRKAFCGANQVQAKLARRGSCIPSSLSLKSPIRLPGREFSEDVRLPAQPSQR
jgi:hypothetical protein